MQRTHPLTMTTLSTHDTKRSDDVRARLAVLSEIPEEFAAAVTRWSAINDGLRRNGFPDRNTEWFYYQTLIGAWPLPVERAKAYMQKATREAKQQTTWTANNKEFEDALCEFIEATLASAEFIAEIESFVAKIIHAGRLNSLAQTLLKYTAPGVPDLYQGSELWDLSLVDPDNRRPVDYECRRNLLKDLDPLKCEESAAVAMSKMNEGVPKLWTIHRALMLRKRKPEWFGAGAAYTPLPAQGAAADHAVAYQRADSVLTIVPRLPHTLAGAWRGTTIQIPQGRWSNALTGEVLEGGRVAVETLLKTFPVALLTKEEKHDA